MINIDSNILPFY